MSEDHILFNSFFQPAARPPSFLTVFLPHFAFPSAGAIDKIVFPVGMQSVNFEDCSGLTGNIAQLNLPVGMKELNLSRCNGKLDYLTMQTVGGITGTLPASERAKVKNYDSP